MVQNHYDDPQRFNFSPISNWNHANVVPVSTDAIAQSILIVKRCQRWEVIAAGNTISHLQL